MYRWMILAVLVVGTGIASSSVMTAEVPQGKSEWAAELFSVEPTWTKDALRVGRCLGELTVDGKKGDLYALPENWQPPAKPQDREVRIACRTARGDEVKSVYNEHGVAKANVVLGEKYVFEPILDGIRKNPKFNWHCSLLKTDGKGETFTLTFKDLIEYHVHVRVNDSDGHSETGNGYFTAHKTFEIMKVVSTKEVWGPKMPITPRYEGPIHLGATSSKDESEAWIHSGGAGLDAKVFAARYDLTWDRNRRTGLAIQIGGPIDVPAGHYTFFWKARVTTIRELEGKTYSQSGYKGRSSQTEVGSQWAFGWLYPFPVSQNPATRRK